MSKTSTFHFYFTPKRATFPSTYQTTHSFDKLYSQIAYLGDGSAAIPIPNLLCLHILDNIRNTHQWAAVGNTDALRI